MKARLLVLMCGLIVGLGGCSTKSNNNPELMRRITWDPNHVQLTCPSADCPPGVGVLVFLTPQKIGRCTATLIAADQILTDGHCDLSADVDSDKSETGAWTNAFFFVNDPTSGETQIYEIGQSLFYDQPLKATAGKNLGLSEDLAVLQLRDSVPDEIAPRSVSRQIPANMNALVGFVVNDPAQEFENFAINKITCGTQPKSTDHAGVLDLGIGLDLLNCVIVPGNSGGPVFTPPDFLNIQVVVNVTVDGATTPWGRGNRIQCLDLVGILPPAAQTCPQ